MNRDDIGELFFVGFEGTSVSDNLKRFLLDLKPAGVILFARNIEEPAQVAALNRDLQLLAMDHWTTGLLIGVDQEGGRVRRLRAPFVSCPSARILSSDPRADELVRSYATIMAHELKLVGFNTNFTPVLDVLSENSDAATSVIGDRSFGADPAAAARLGQIVIQSVRSAWQQQRLCIARALAMKPEI
ncbi:MAG: glycoside hydrolase family 3 N-terminal domain-containing protein, partial [Desulfomonilaceae bacterium]